ncbi:hypothetical protein TKK_0007834 [Trichogramma kaykai]|uniref:Uncharacterized protein n=1 Tax=Trichogramma kaykai TaxID=54128 RepID=A0ABD2X7W7_9HYME
MSGKLIRMSLVGNVIIIDHQYNERELIEKILNYIPPISIATSYMGGFSTTWFNIRGPSDVEVMSRRFCEIKEIIQPAPKIPFMVPPPMRKKREDETTKQRKQGQRVEPMHTPPKQLRLSATEEEDDDDDEDIPIVIEEAREPIIISDEEDETSSTSSKSTNESSESALGSNQTTSASNTTSDEDDDASRPEEDGAKADEKGDSSEEVDVQSMSSKTTTNGKEKPEVIGLKRKNVPSTSGAEAFQFKINTVSDKPYPYVCGAIPKNNQNDNAYGCLVQNNLLANNPWKNPGIYNVTEESVKAITSRLNNDTGGSMKAMISKPNNNISTLAINN